MIQTNCYFCNDILPRPSEDKLFISACSVCFWAEMIQQASSTEINKTSIKSTELLYNEIIQQLWRV